MKYCPEIAVLQSALALIEKQVCSSSWTLQPKVKKEKLLSLTKDDASKYVHIIHGTIDEITRGLENDNSKEQQDSWQRRLYNILLYRVMLSNYENVDNQDDGKHYQIDITSRILPDISVQLFLEVVKDCQWLNVFIDNLQFFDDSLSLRLVHDCLLHISHNPVRIQDVTFGFIILDWIFSKLMTAVDYNSTTRSDNKPQVLECESHDNSLNSAATMTEYMKCLKLVLEFFNQELPNYINNTVNIDDMVISYFCQILMFGVIKFMNYQQFCSWSRMNIYGCQVLPSLSIATVSLNRRDPLYGKFSTGDLKPKLLDIDYTLFGIVKTELPLDLWNQCLETLLQKDHVLKALKRSTDHEQKSQTQLVKTPVLLSTRQNVQSNFSIVCDIDTLISQFWIGLQNTSVLFELSKENIISQLSITVDFPKFTEDEDIWSLPAVLWRIDNRQPGYKAGVQKLVAMFGPEIWSKEEVLTTLTTNIDVIGYDEVMMSLYQLVVELSDSDCRDKLKQLTLDGFSLLDNKLKNKHIVHVYQNYGCWPLSRETDLELDVMSTLNKLTSEADQQVSSDIFKLTLQNASLFVDKAVHRMVSSTQQALIIVQTFDSIGAVCRSKHNDFPQHSVLGHSLHNLLTGESLTAKEQQSVIYFIQQSLMTSSETTPSKYRGNLSALDVKELIQQTVIPFINVPSVYSSQPMKTTFALEIAVTVLSSFVKPECSLAVDNSVKQEVVESVATIMMCICELFHECVTLWDDQESTVWQSKTQLLENLVQLQQIMKYLKTESLLVNCLAGDIEDLDWTVSLRMMELYSDKDNYTQMCQEFCSRMVNGLEADDSDDRLIDLLRCSSVSDELMEAAITVTTGSDITFTYESLVLALVQLLPNLVTREWTRCLHFVHILLEKEIISVTYRAMSGMAVPIINLEGIHLQLQLSQCLHDFLVLLPQSSMGTCIGAVSHCVKNYVTTLKESVVVNLDSLPPGCASFLLCEVFSHTCSATRWMSQTSLEPINVILLDVVCMFQELGDSLDTKKLKVNYHSQSEVILQNTMKYVLDAETKDMIIKKLDT